MNAFSRSRRLLKKADYDYVFHEAKKKFSPHFIFLYRNNEVGSARLGFALSKKMIAKAHDRTRIKRVLRESFRVTHHLPAVDIVVLARPKVAKVANSLLWDDLGNIWLQLCVP